MPKLALGTVQLGLDYGISNTQGKVTFEAAESLLKQADSLSIDMLDTAAMYGNSETVLGLLANEHVNIVTKLALNTNSTINLSALFNESLNKLKRHAVYGVMLHDANVLNSIHASDIAAQLSQLKALGLVKKIGVSLYHPEQIHVFDKLKPDLIQIPLNILDQRFLENNLLKKLKAQGIEIHVRSAFLQGLLLMPPKTRHTYFKQFDELNTLDRFFCETPYSRLELCLNFLKSIDDIDRVVVGCCSASELLQIHTAWQTKITNSYHQFASTNNALIIPSNWPKL